MLCVSITDGYCLTFQFSVFVAPYSLYVASYTLFTVLVYYQQAYFYVHVFNPLASSNRQTTVTTCFRPHDCEKRQVYEQCVLEVEQDSFTAL